MMDIERIKDLSVYYWVKDKFQAYPFVTVQDGFPEDKLVIPTVAVEWGRIRTVPVELGNREEQFVRIWYIDIFAKTKSQRDDFGYYLLRELQNTIPVNDYNVGFPPDVTPPQIGYLLTYDKELEPVLVMSELVSEMYYRSRVSFLAEYSEI